MKMELLTIKQFNLSVGGNQKINNSSSIDATGYTCLGIEYAPCEKKGWFGWK